MTPYQLKIQKRRTLISIGVAVLFHLLLIGAYLVYEYLFVEDMAEFSGPVLVKLGEPEGEDIPVLPDPDIPVERPDDKTEPVPPPPAEAVESQAETVSPAASSEPSPDGTLPEQPTSESAVSSEPYDEPVEQPPAEEIPVRPQPEEPVEPQPVIIKGEEGGNSYEYQFAAEEGLVKRSLSAAIFLYMPLPATVSADIYGAMTGESSRFGLSRQELFSKYYMEVNGTWFYDTKPPVDDLRSLWDYLITAGYDYKNADYKSSVLRDVEIVFSISPDAKLLNAEIRSSSGRSDVDAAVLQGFQAASFSNASGREIKGRFTYRFH